MAKQKFYAVQKGHVPGIYASWDEAKVQVDGFAGAVYKSFSSKEEAALFLEKDGYDSKDKHIDVPDTAYAFVDGSYNAQTKVYGYGGFLVLPADGGPRKRLLLQGHDNDPEMVGMHNVAGEVLGATAAIDAAAKLKLSKLTIFYDYLGVEGWGMARDGIPSDERVKPYRANKTGTRTYQNRAELARQSGMTLVFQHVDAHTGIDGNELADRLAKEAVGIASLSRGAQAQNKFDFVQSEDVLSCEGGYDNAQL